MSLLEYLTSNDVPVPHIVRHQTGKFFLHQPTQTYGVLFQYIEGKHIELPSREKKHSIAMGKYIAILNNFLSVDKIQELCLTVSTMRGTLEIEWILERVKKYLPSYSSDNTILNAQIISNNLQNALNYIDEERKLVDHLFKNLPYGILHADMHEYNVLFNESEDDLNGILDWESISFGPLIAEVSMCVVEWCIQIDEEDDIAYFDPELLKVLVDSYKTYRPSVSEEEINSIYLFSIIMFLYQAEFLISPSIRKSEEGRQYLDTQLPMVNELIELSRELYKQ